MPGLNLGFYIAPWIFAFLILAGVSAYLFILSSKLDVNDPTDDTNSNWAKINYGVAAGVAFFAIITVPLGYLHQKHLRKIGYRMGMSKEAQLGQQALQAMKFKSTMNAMQSSIN